MPTWKSALQEFREQSQNVYENKGSGQNSITTGPSLSKEGNPGTPLLRRGGVGGGGSLCLGRVASSTPANRRNKARMSMKTKDRCCKRFVEYSMLLKTPNLCSICNYVIENKLVSLAEAESSRPTSAHGPTTGFVSVPILSTVMLTVSPG
jgi:hypothetical protein